jgi:hypothetical protein
VGLAAGAAGAPAGDDGPAAGAGVLEALWIGTITGAEDAYPAVLSAAEGAAEVRVRVRAGLGRLSCRLGRVVSLAAGEVTLRWSPGSSTAPAKVSGRRGPPELAMAATVTTLTAVAAIDSHSAGG